MTRDRDDIRELVYAPPQKWEESWTKQLDLIMEEENNEKN